MSKAPACVLLPNAPERAHQPFQMEKARRHSRGATLPSTMPGATAAESNERGRGPAPPKRHRPEIGRSHGPTVEKTPEQQWASARQVPR